jgi:hypothetical protein
MKNFINLSYVSEVTNPKYPLHMILPEAVRMLNILPSSA